MEPQKTPNTQGNPDKKITKLEVSHSLIQITLQSYSNQNSMASAAKD